MRKKLFTRVADLHEVDKMDRVDFERYLYLVPLFESIGYRAEVTKEFGNYYGAELVLKNKRKKLVVQAKLSVSFRAFENRYDVKYLFTCVSVMQQEAVYLFDRLIRIREE